MNKENNSIINVTVNGMKVSETIKSVRTRLESVEKSAFNIALLCAYGTGATIPSYTDNKGNEHGEAVCDDAMKQNEFVKLVGRSEATISRWLKAFRLIVENGYFTDFSNGVYPFSFDKIITIFENAEVFKGYVFADLMNLAATTLTSMVKSYKPKTDEGTTEEEVNKDFSDESSEEESQVEAVETTVLSYNGKEYTVNKAVFEKWLEENTIIA